MPSDLYLYFFLFCINPKRNFLFSFFFASYLIAWWKSIIFQNNGMSFHYIHFYPHNVFSASHRVIACVIFVKINWQRFHEILGTASCSNAHVHCKYNQTCITQRPSIVVMTITLILELFWNRKS